MSSAVGKVGSEIKDVFSSDSMKLKGTDYTMGELKEGGWTPDMVAKGEWSPTNSRRIARGVLGAIGGASSGSAQQQPQGGSGVQIDTPSAPQVDFAAIAAQADPLALFLKKNRFGAPQYTNNNNMLLGG